MVARGSIRFRMTMACSAVSQPDRRQRQLGDGVFGFSQLKRRHLGKKSCCLAPRCPKIVSRASMSMTGLFPADGVFHGLRTGPD